MATDSKIVVDYVIYICKGCKSERKAVFKTSLQSSEEILGFLKGDHPPCSCKADKCDIKMHMKPVD